jgi:hypothetical protein
LVERCICNADVISSNLIISTEKKLSVFYHQLFPRC